MEIKYELTVDYDDSPVMEMFDTGNKESDQEIVNEIHRRLDQGDFWAWAVVKVWATISEFEGACGIARLWGCSYDSEADFRQNSGYYEQMKEEARADLMHSLRALARKGKEAEKALASFNETV